jgi:glycosyltransferase involved in cell wall biosynthesis
MNLPKFSAVMCTYGRFTVVERTLNCFLQQTYPNKELIIYNTDVDSPYIDDGCKLLPHGVLIINNNIDFVTKEPYTNVGAIRRDALTFAGGDYTCCFDDDDIFLPHYIQQGINRVQETGLPFFKPELSFFYCGNVLQLVRNTMEASVCCDINKVREYGYLLETGSEGLGWYTKARDNRELNEYDKHYIPSYCFNWNDGEEMKAPHKQSGNINSTENFNEHKAHSLDKVDGRSLQIWEQDKVDWMYQPYKDFLLLNKVTFNQELFNKYKWW